MNPDVSGSYRVADPASLLIAEPEYFHQFSLIIATQLPEDQLQILAKLLEAKRTPLVVRLFSVISLCNIAGTVIRLPLGGAGFTIVRAAGLCANVRF
jgi:hypothetical protein